MNDIIYYTYQLCFVNKEGDKLYYIGISKNIKKRLLKHQSDLLGIKHHNKLLQKMYNEGYVYDDKPKLFEFNNRADSIKKEHELILKFRKQKKCLNLETIPQGYKDEELVLF